MGTEGNEEPVKEDHLLAATADLITRARAGDQGARSEIVARYRAPLVRFLHRRLSGPARHSLDTSDIVQDALLAALQRIETFEYRGLGAFWMYLRRIGLNFVLTEERRRNVRGNRVASSNGLEVTTGKEEGPASNADRQEVADALEDALEGLPERVREALLLRIELGLPYGVVASECGYPSAEAARMAIVRALEGLAKELKSMDL